MTRNLNSARRGAEQPTSMVVFVHGYGADGADLLGLAEPLAPHMPDTVFYAPDAPQPLHPMGRQWFPIPRFDGSTPEAAAAGLNAAADDLNAFLDAALQAEGLTPDRLILLGFSQGAMMSMHVAPRRNTAIAGVVAISGKLMYPEQLGAEAVVKPEVILIHGDRDDVVPFAEMNIAAQALNKAGFSTYGHVMRGGGHGITPDALGAALAFMSDQLKLSR